MDEIPALAEKDDDSVINSLEQIIPGTAAEFDFNHQRLNLSIPQIAPGDYVTILRGHATIRRQAGTLSVVIYNVISRR